MKKNKFQMKREQTYAQLIESGVKLLCEKGYALTSIEDITTAAGYTKGAFYVHFKNKEEFFFDLLDHRHGVREEWPEITQGEGGETLDSLESVLQRRMNIFLDYLSRSPEWQMVYIEFYLMKRDHDEVRERYKQYYEKFIAEFVRLIDSFKEKGWVSQEVDTLKTARQIYQLLDGAIIHFNLYGEPLDKEALITTMIKMLK